MIESTMVGDESSPKSRLTRRQLLSSAAALAIASAGGGAVSALWPRGSLAASDPQLARTAIYLLSVGGVGGAIESLIDMQQLAAPALATQFRFAMGWTPPKPLADWVDATVQHRPTLQAGSLLVGDTYQSLRAYNWSNGSIARIELPGCDATSTATASPILTVQATLLASGVATGPVSGRMLTRPWQQRSFRVTATAPIDPSLVRVSRVSGITLDPKVRGGTFDITMAFGLTQPDLMAPFTAAIQHAGDLLPDRPTDITLHMLAPDLRSDIAAVVLHGCRVLSIDNPAPTTADVVPMTIVKMSFADASLVISPA